MRSSTASVTWTPQNGIPIHPIFNSAVTRGSESKQNGSMELKSQLGIATACSVTSQSYNPVTDEPIDLAYKLKS